ncbi:hypothetical protein EDEG_02060 [Edhazardia aedis USNM 41457]|uniref:Uncharacterized protein n=1 Tax=Edhazardia aedis (strain USNM 41457) TaxID=1003232 RepID=J9D7Z9_EDHAE|nr:hypothetical protein EDEG_02060 [Edhazardia aedis USNM 41457]|eukprot:EJW03629.1 hypothetical protein EDEG_02060 [Edhazardia aedis USNM 41457]
MANSFFRNVQFFTGNTKKLILSILGFFTLQPLPTLTNPLSIADLPNEAVDAYSQTNSPGTIPLYNHNSSSNPLFGNSFDKDAGSLAYKAYANSRNSTEEIDLDLKNVRLERFRRSNAEVLNSNVETSTKGYLLDYDYLTDYFSGGHTDMFSTHSIDEIFDGFETTENINDEFTQKGILHKILLRSKVVQNLFKNVKELRSLEEQTWEFYWFYDEFTYYKTHYDEEDKKFHLKKRRNVDHFCANKNGNKKKDIISADRNIFEENYIFIEKYNSLFKVFWQKFFYELNKSNLPENKLNELGSFYTLNKDVNSRYDLSNISFADKLHLKFKTHPHDAKERIHLTFNSLNKVKILKFLDNQIYLENALKAFFRYSRPQIQFHSMFEVDLVTLEKSISLYGEQKLTEISKFVRMLLLKALVYNEYLSDEQIRALMNYKEETTRESEINTDSGEEDDNSLLIKVWDFSIDEDCDQGSCKKVCGDDIVTYVNLVTIDRENLRIRPFK